MQHQFPAPTPQQVYVELADGEVTLQAVPTDVALVEVTGDGAEDVTVEQDGDELRIVAPRRTGFLVTRSSVRARLTVPEGSALATKLGSADVTCTGPLGSARVATGSGAVSLESVQGPAGVRTGSGDVLVGVLGDAELKAGSGDITVEEVTGSASLTTGSGDLRVVRSRGPLTLRSGSGDVVVDEAAGEADLSTASGDLRVGRIASGQVRLHNVSGDIRLGIPAGTPVWTDVSSTTGRVRSTLAPTGAPADGQPYVEVRASTVTGDIHLEQLAPSHQEQS